MMTLTFFSIATIILGFVVFFVSVYFTKPFSGRILLVTLYVISSSLLFGWYSSLTGLPRDFSLHRLAENIDESEYKILAHLFNEGESILLWVRKDDQIPTYLRLEWNEDFAEAIKGSIKDARLLGSQPSMPSLPDDVKPEEMESGERREGVEGDGGTSDGERDRSEFKEDEDGPSDGAFNEDGLIIKPPRY